MFTRSNQGIINSWWWKIDKISLVLIIALVLFGLICVATSSFSVAKKIDVTGSYFIIKHINYALLASFIMIMISFLEIETIKKYTINLFALFFILVIATFFFGTEIKGSKRWLYFWGLSLQPSEFLKVFFAIINSLILSEIASYNAFKIYFFSFLLCALTMGILAAQPDIGMASLIFFTWICQIFISGISFALLLIPIIFFLICGISAYFIFDHVHYRINNFIHSVSGGDQLYQVKQAAAAFHKGGLFGVGPGQGKVKINLPDSHTDFIFSVIGEEFGILSCLLLLIIYLAIVVRSLNKVTYERNLFQVFTITGLSMQFVIQALINIGVNIRLLPAKGMTLPFISYGGSSMLATGLLLGIILAMNKKKYGYLQNI